MTDLQHPFYNQSTHFLGKMVRFHPIFIGRFRIVSGRLGDGLGDHDFRV